jgi:hypothetical protein
MKKLPLSKQLTLIAIVGGVALITSFLLSLLAAAASAKSGVAQPGPSPLIGLCFGVVAGGIYIGLSNNRRVALADDDARAAAMRPVTDDGAQLLVYRQGFVGKLAGVDIHVDGVVRTQLKSPRFASLPVTPGAHTLQSEVQNKKSDVLEFMVAAGGTVAVEIVVALGKTRLVRHDDLAAVRARLAQVPMVAA